MAGEVSQSGLSPETMSMLEKIKGHGKQHMVGTDAAQEGVPQASNVNNMKIQTTTAWLGVRG